MAQGAESDERRGGRRRTQLSQLAVGREGSGSQLQLGTATPPLRSRQGRSNHRSLVPTPLPPPPPRRAQQMTTKKVKAPTSFSTHSAACDAKHRSPSSASAFTGGLRIVMTATPSRSTSRLAPGDDDIAANAESPPNLGPGGCT